MEKEKEVMSMAERGSPTTKYLAREVTLRLAGCIVLVQCADAGVALVTTGPHQPFLVPGGPADLVLEVHSSPAPVGELGARLFASPGDPWSLCLYRRGGDFVLQVLAREQPYVLAIFEPGLSRGRIFLGNGTKPQEAEAAQKRIFAPLPFLDQLLVSQLLCHGRGLFFHASGVVWGGKALVFCGSSGAGKSTLARLWRDRGARMLNQDRVFLGRPGGSFWAYGTFWHNERGMALPENAPLAAVYFIGHARENRLTPLERGSAVTPLLANSLLPVWDEEVTGFALGYLEQLSREVPCYQLGFVPDERIIDLLLGQG